MAKKKHSASARVSPAKIRADEARFLVNTYRRPPVVFTHGRGCRVYDSQGRAYLDFLGGIAVNALGHAHPRLVRVIRREAARAIHLSSSAIESNSSVRKWLRISSQRWHLVFIFCQAAWNKGQHSCWT